MDITTYLDVLTRIREYLRSYDEKKWSTRLDEWIRELRGIDSTKALRIHIERSRRATGGMGSLGDLTICPQAGHAIVNDRAAISAASQQLWSMTSQLYAETTRLLHDLPDE